MREEDFIGWLSSLLSNELDGVEIRTRKVENERPVPLVLISDWKTEEQSYNNSSYAGWDRKDYDDDGDKEYQEYLNFSLGTRVEFVLRHNDEVLASRLKDNFKEVLRIVDEYAQHYHDDLKNIKITADGEPTHEFVEATEYELMVAAWFYYDHTVVRTEDELPNSRIRTANETLQIDD